ncbi:SDR family oxidoreductase [Blastococcus capsensis]|uniref:SDR family oxidoreductase n=1 Tax=Blastococcus capsensis TaxID=1564163 RepID=UPI002540EB7B|nr:SDR family oxidoreductase [Blastococcus capsensis]MDK3256736.1 SDR family oxidoreductase [Blastococcus capsensis]
MIRGSGPLPVHDRVARPGGTDRAALVLEVSDMGVTVNDIAPGMVLPPVNQKAIDDPDFREEQVQSIPRKRPALPEEVGRLAVLLASSEAEHVTGATYGHGRGPDADVGPGRPTQHQE